MTYFVAEDPECPVPGGMDEPLWVEKLKEGIAKSAAVYTPPQDHYGLLNVLLPSGVGDLYWVLAKWLPTFQSRRDVMLYLPGNESKRAGSYLSAHGLRFRYLPKLMTSWVWSQPGEPEVPIGHGWVTLHANAHLEAGRPLADWYPDLPLQNPLPPAPPCAHALESFGRELFLLVVTSHHQYMGRNLSYRQWGKLLREVHQETGLRYRFAAYGGDKYLANKVREDTIPGLEVDQPPLFDHPITDVMAAIASPHCAGVIGVACGPTILAVAAGKPTTIAYPRWLAPMIGAWEPPGARAHACFLDELPERAAAVAAHTGLLG